MLKACLMNVHKWLCLSNFLPFPKGQLCLNKRPSDRVHLKLPSCVSDTVVVMKPQKLKSQKLIHEKSLTLFGAFKLKAKFSRSYSFQSLSFQSLSFKGI